jgi:hypothetical protein
MQRTAKKANLATTGPVRFHRIRAWTYNKLLQGFSEPEAKYIVGKAIPHSDSTYLRLREGIERKYPKVYDEYLNISGRHFESLSDEDREALALVRDPLVMQWIKRKMKEDGFTRT